jgi:hypothetical protein
MRDLEQALTAAREQFTRLVHSLATTYSITEKDVTR